jgi:hypothetical protein
MMCECKKLPGGNTVVCDSCASQMINMLSDLVPSEAIAASVEQVMTQKEYQGFQSAVDLWLRDLQVSQQQGGDVRW